MRCKTLKYLLIVYFFVILGCKPSSKVNEIKNLNSVCLECVNGLIEIDSVVYYDIEPIIEIVNENSLSVDKEIYTIDSDLKFMNYSISRLNSDGAFDSIVEENDTSLSSYKSFFKFNGKNYSIIEIIENDKIAPYNFVIDSIGYTINKENRIYIAKISSDCEACFERLVYTIIFQKKKIPSFIFCNEYLFLE